MANYCETDIVFVAKVPSYAPCMVALKDFHRKLMEAFNSEKHYPWLTVIAEKFGITYESNDYYHTDGTLYWVEEENPETSQFGISQEDKWSPNCKLWLDIIAKYYTENGEPLIDVFYRAQEPGMELYCTNDIDATYTMSDVMPVNMTVNVTPGVYNQMKFIDYRPGNPILKINRDLLNECDLDMDFHIRYIHDNEDIIMYIWMFDDTNFRNENELLDVMNTYIFKTPVSSIEEAAQKDYVELSANHFINVDINELD